MAATGTQGGASAPPCVIAAATYIVRGWRVFALRGKVPLPGSHGYKDATLDPAALLNWPEGANIGIATGSGLVVLDVDEGGFDALYELERKHGSLPETPSVKTGNGQHFYFTTSRQVGCSTDRRRKIDIRGDGGYVVAPPSTHPSGRRYEWDVHPGDVPLASVPDWAIAGPATAGRRAGTHNGPRARRGLDALAPADYIRALTGLVTGPSGKIRCPFHHDSTPSLHVYPTAEQGWTCFGCGAGGSIVDFGAHLFEIEPRGRGYWDVRRRLEQRLLIFAAGGER